MYMKNLFMVEATIQKQIWMKCFCCDTTHNLCSSAGDREKRSHIPLKQRGPTTSDLRAILQKRNNSRATSNKMM